MSRKYVNIYSGGTIPVIIALIKALIIIPGLPFLLIFSISCRLMDTNPYASYYKSEIFLSNLSLGVVFIICFFMIKIRRRYKKNIITVLESVKMEGVFEPSPNDEHFGFFQYNYFDIDVMNGTFVYIGNVNERSKLFSENMLVVGFDMHNWRSLELKGNELIINMNDPRLPYINVINKNTPIFYEKLNAMRSRHYDYPHSFPNWVDFKASQAVEELGQNLIPIQN
ncbi:plasmid IncI1-type surface exclusion protein ExcA [Klebsiella aerogenes]|uniref:plasmid IncI1-type surface exclusion protein ExcA n=1 Tax=Klebsiella aerogenes TaxID=548 RepID=UPI00066546FF|nr:plasmid IncI1-type surface exclusion protein ExcA [Klebsiella aerogenes]